MKNPDLSESFFVDTICNVGVLEEMGTGKRIAVYMVDFGKSTPSPTKNILSQQPISLNTDRTENGRYVFCIHGNRLIAEKDSDQIMTPAFSSLFEVDEDEYRTFYENFNQAGVWLLIVKSRVTSFFYINKDGAIIDCFETYRELFRKIR